MFTVIGDLVGSRRLPDRAAAQRRLGDVLTEVNAALAPAQDFEATIGDEFQGATADLATALLAGLLIRLRMLEVVDVRCGYGAGEVTVHDPSRRPLLQDGPGWWAARAAIDELGRRRAARSWYDAGESVGESAAAGAAAGGAAAAAAAVGQVNAFLLTRDALVDRLSDRGRRLLDGALCGATQRELAEREGITEGAVSQQFARGVGAVRDAHLVLAAATGTFGTSQAGASYTEVSQAEVVEGER
ncbi:hypothetical protein JK386_00415 [Nocardioides sp. zg-536]|uniref:RNA polymerase subunit sigma-70 n=1 Tax=Nocardioides faecalis TaxID=2803858 RepID=A0A938Y6E8_9ACTN|nr:SatD family protein [Nocardioides faecalis]MBM9458361.1 hypothetical protein [Nocardioides faecalis]QVI58383.1 hypothetical protein KG111_15495 [Nocardioides faecalis]